MSYQTVIQFIKTTKKKVVNSLYYRALLFTAIGCGSLLGAIYTQSNIILDYTVDKLLEERIGLSRTTGSYVENLIQKDFLKIEHELRVVLEDKNAIKNIIDDLVNKTIFQEGVILLDKDQNVVASANGLDTKRILSSADLNKLISNSKGSRYPVASTLISGKTNKRFIILFLKEIHGPSSKLYGHLITVLNPASHNLLLPFETFGANFTSTLQLVEQGGNVIASTNPTDLFQQTDHGDILRRAIIEKKVVHGRCHSCHDGNNNREKVTRKSEILAFSPLPNMNLGMAVRQPESTALALAFHFKWRIIWLGIAFVVLFLIFTGLAIHSVISPLSRLTKAVRAIDNFDPTKNLPVSGKDEVGELGKVLNVWRKRGIYTLAALRKQKENLDTEMMVARNHIRNMQEIASFSIENIGPKGTVEKGLAVVLRCTGLKYGYLSLKYGDQEFIHYLNIPEDKVHCLFSDKSRVIDVSKSYESNSPVIGKAKIRIMNNVGEAPKCCPEYKTIIIAEIVGANNIEVTCLLVDSDKREYKQFHHRLQSLLHQIITSVANQLLIEEKSRRHHQSQEFLQRVLRSQEEERRRVARELHDTLAQDLAAHRLNIERLTSPKHLNNSEEMKDSLIGLEANSKDMLLNLREIMFDLRPSVLEEMGFLRALQWYLERLETQNKIDGILDVKGSEKQASYLVQITLFRIFQEALHNIVAHAKASMVSVTVEYCEDNFVHMVVKDDGKGFVLDDLKKDLKERKDRGLGILGMKERSELLKASFDITSELNVGTTISVKCPIKVEEIV